ncbi:AraC family transcriptional regulator N-terminal domain-containing protein [candidate division KSB1 bacterium]|nr:AraC family transcriptional regulator N-terminal domain-containing protein [candidate division KSB1 bacterium]
MVDEILIHVRLSLLGAQVAQIGLAESRDNETSIPGVTLYRCSTPTELSAFFYQPRLSVALQGMKRVVLDDE